MSTQPTAAIEKVSQTSPLITHLAERWKINPATMINTLKATVFPQKDRDSKPVVVTNEQLMAFLQVAHEYNLNPFTKEIYAFPTKGGGIVPMVPVDGWSNIVNRHPQMDGLKFEDDWFIDTANNNKRSLVSVTCVIFRKDRTHPTSVTEYMQECYQPSKEPWLKWPARMLRHKAFIQCARIAFSLGGIYDPDEAERIAEGTDEKPKGIERPRAVTVDGSATVVNIDKPTPQEATPRTQEATQETAQESAQESTQACKCSCCKSDKCECATKEEFDRCGCESCLKAVEHPKQAESERPTSAGADSSTPAASAAAPANADQPTGEQIFGKAPAVVEYMPEDKLKKLFMVARSMGIEVKRGSHDDQLHKLLKDKYGIESVKQIPVSQYEKILKDIGGEKLKI